MDGTPFKLQVKIGNHEFSAEGEQEAVQRQFEVWRELIAAPTAAAAPASPGSAPASQVEQPSLDPESALYDKIFRHDGKGAVSLTVLPQGADGERDAALLLLLGRRHYEHEEQVTGQRLLSGLKESGLPVERADRMFGDYMDRYLLRAGAHRAVRYRLTNPGLDKARELARLLVGRVA